MTPELRTKVLSEWRGYREKAAAPERMQAVSDALEKVMRQLGLQERLTESQIVNAWREIVGEWLALHTCPDRLRNGTLYVRLVQSSVQFELDRNWKPEIIQKLKARFPATRIREIKFRVG
jgi:predicted nucleic acid-binding Zn ribbon protein